MRALIGLALVSVLLAGCSSKEDRAVESCSAEIARQFTDKTYEIDEADMRANVKPEGDDMLRVTSSITFDPGLPREVKQTFDCKVRVRDDAMEVISVQYIW